MKYSFEKISTVEACEALLAGAQQKKEKLTRRVRNQGESVATYRRRVDDLHQESALVQATLDAFTTAYEALPESKHKADMKVKVKRLETRQAVLEKRAYTCNVAALLVKEMKYNALESQLSALEAYIAAVDQWYTMLRQTALRARRTGIALRELVAQRPAVERGEYPVQTFVPMDRSNYPLSVCPQNLQNTASLSWPSLRQ